MVFSAQRILIVRYAQVKSLAKPPYGVKLTMEATCIMFGVKPDKINDPDNPGKKV